MKIGFLDSVSNSKDVFPVAAKLATERIAGVELVRYTAPGVLKIPVSAKKLFEQGCDAVLVLVIADEEAVDELSLVHEKTIDIELQYGKFVFYCILLEGEWKDDNELNELAGTRISQCLELISKTGATSGLSGDIGSTEIGDAFAAMNLAALTGAMSESGGSSQTSGTGSEGAGGTDDLHKIF